jgi:predicted Zn finger-like uncharacterized protein
MDVRCERCRAQYVFDDDQVTPTGLTVQCTNCGHVFKVRKKELVVTVPVKPEELAGPPLPASSAGPRSPAPASPPAPSAAGRILTPVPAKPAPPPPLAAGDAREWRVRQANGNVFAFRELTTLQKWIIEQKVSRDDEISQGGENWKRLGNIPDLASFFQVVEAAERGKVQASTPTLTPVPVPYPVAFPQGMYPPAPAYGQPPYPAPAPPAAPAHPDRAPTRRRLDDEFDPGERERPRKRGGGGRVAFLVFLLLLAAGGAAAYLLRPEWLAPLGLVPPRNEFAVPITVSVPAEEERPAAPAPPAGAASPAPGEAVATGPAASGGEAAGTAAGAEGAAAGAPAGESPAGAVSSNPVPAPEPVDAALPKPPEPVAKPAAEPPPPKSPKVLLAEATRLRLRGSVERALDLYGQVIAAQPQNAEALSGRGLCYLDLSSYAPAEASFRAALRMDPEQPDALLGLAETYRSQGRRADAIQFFEKYLAFHPDGDEAAVARNAIAQLRE